MLVGCQATTPDELTRMLADFPGIGAVRLTEQVQSLACVQQVQAAGAESVVLCNKYGSLASQVKAALTLPGVAYAEVGNEPYWEGVSITQFAAEVYNLLVGLSAADRARVAVACMAGTSFDPASLLKAEPRLRGLVTTLACHPYDAYGTGPKGASGTGTPLKSGGQRYAETHDAWVKATGLEVDVVATEVGWCTSPYKPGSLPLVTEAQQAQYVTAAFVDFASHPFVKAATLYHFRGYDEPKAAAADPHNTVRFNGIVHWDYSPKPGWQALADAIAKFRPGGVVSPPPAPFAPAAGKRTRTPSGLLGTIAGIADPEHVVVALDGGGVGNWPASKLLAA
jgi:hypothetical protein